MRVIFPTRQGVSAKGARPAEPGLLPEELRRAREFKLDLRAAFAIVDALAASFAIEMPPNADWVVGWAVQAGKLQPGTSARWSVLERAGKRVLGGNTYILRVPTREALK